MLMAIGSPKLKYHLIAQVPVGFQLLSGASKYDQQSEVIILFSS